MLDIARLFGTIAKNQPAIFGLHRVCYKEATHLTLGVLFSKKSKDPARI